MTMKKRSEQIRETIGHLMYEQQLAQTSGHDHQYDHIQDKIDQLRCKLKTVEWEEFAAHNENED